MTPEPRDGGLGVRDQIRRYRSAFTAIVVMVVVAAGVGGYILSKERLHLPGWVPVFGRSFYTLKAEIQTAQALTPGQGQAVTIAGANIGEVAAVELHNGDALVTMRIIPKYARIYRDATLLMRPKTQLKDMTVEVDPGEASTGKLPSGSTLPLDQTAPDINFDEFLAGLDAETRDYLQELLAGAGEGLHDNGKELAATFKRFDPTAKALEHISKELAVRHRYIAESIHNFQLLISALGNKDHQLTEVISSSNEVFATFAKEDAAVQSTLKLLPGTLEKTKAGIGKVATAAKVLGPTLHKLQPFASALGPALKETRPFLEQTTPIFKNEIRPFAKEVLPVINEIHPATAKLSAATPELSKSFSVINEFFNELAYNPGPKQGGFLFFLDWANHNFNSVLSSADGGGDLGNTLPYFNCSELPILYSAAEVNPTVRLLIGLLSLPAKSSCPTASATTSTTTSSTASKTTASKASATKASVAGASGATAKSTAAKSTAGGASATKSTATRTAEAKTAAGAGAR